MTELRQAIIALGSNIGGRQANLSRALELLEASPGIKTVILAPVYETAPVGVEDQPSFLNSVAGVETWLSPEELMNLLLEIEQALGRVRVTRWGPRIIDLDLLFFEGEERDTPDLTLPHPRWAERSFVTTPLRDLLSLPPFDSPLWDPVRKKLENPPA